MKNGVNKELKPKFAEFIVCVVYTGYCWEEDITAASNVERTCTSYGIGELGLNFIGFGPHFCMIFGFRAI